MKGKRNEGVTGISDHVPFAVHACSFLLVATFWVVYFVLYEFTENDEILQYLLMTHLPFVSMPYLAWVLLNEGNEKLACRRVFRPVVVAVFSSTFVLSILQFVLRLKHG